MLPLLQLLLPEAASKQRVAVLVHPVGEVLTGDADTAALPALKLPVVNEIPLLQNAYMPVYQYYYTPVTMGKCN